VPDRRFKPQWDDAEALADTIVQDLGQRVGFDIAANTLTRTVLSPIEWEEKFRLYRGSGLGLAHGLNQVGGLRPANKDEQLRNLYYVGASTVPGTGLPIVVISSNLVTQRILKDHGSPATV
jgi:phytoene desaturase